MPVFSTGSAEEKSRLMFNVYDVRRRGVLTRDDFTKMIKSVSVSWQKVGREDGGGGGGGVTR